MEIEIEGDAEFVEKNINTFLTIASSKHQDTSRQFDASDADRPTTQEAPLPAKTTAPSEFVRQHSPDTGVETLLVLGSYLETHRDLKDFGAKEIKSLAGEAKLKSIHSQYFTLAIQQGMLRQAGLHRYSLTISGEDCVRALREKSK
ncbi:hypothetical protein [Corallococcus aberystwythensis]|uniref:hypothetical protein n=1 Tax=Corallococcus aberystwythensis TaxID=2316722 RepID=UPI0011C36483|nr:hypothetical protein [Corallococcus aberystwythensis]